MENYGIITSTPPSMQVVANDIASALKKLGYTAKAYNWQLPWFKAKKEFEKGIIFIPFDPLIMVPWVLLQRDYMKHGLPSLTYVTCEGKPKQHLIHNWIREDCTFIACSEFVKEMLNQVDIHPITVIQHGINLETIKPMLRSAKIKGSKLKHKLGVKVLFGTICSTHPRKGLPLLAEAIKQASEELPEAGFIVHTKKMGINFFEENPHVGISPLFGKLGREEILKLIGSLDFLIHPALAEGFCLPLLEAQAFGVPVIYPKYSPLTEITHPTANYPIPTKKQEYVDTGNGILYLYHHYKPEEMVEQIKKAYETYICNPTKYEEQAKTLREHVEPYSHIKTYSKFAEVLPHA